MIFFLSYSSGISDNSQNRKDKKKEAIKKCLQELKSLMPQQGKAKAGTVSTLKTVLQHIKKIKGELNKNTLIKLFSYLLLHS